MCERDDENERNPKSKRHRNGAPAILVALVALLLAFQSAAKAEQTVTLAWNPSTDASVIGYCVYARAENSAAPLRIEAGAASQNKVGGLKEGLRYTFTVRAYNAAGLESGPSNEVTHTVPVPLRIVMPSLSTGMKRLQFPAAPGHWYELQASTDLRTWTTIWQTGVANIYSWVEFQDPLSVVTGKRFYRLQVH